MKPSLSRHGKTALALLLLCTFIAAGLTFAVPPTQAASTTVVISQVYGGGGGSTGYYKNDYVELHNVSTVSQSLDGLSLQYGSSSGNFGSSLTNIYAFPAGTTIPAGGYLLVQLGNTGTAGGVLPVTPDITTTNLSMSGSSGKAALANVTTALGCGATATPCTLPDARIVDLVSYGASNNGEGNTTVNNGVGVTTAQGGVRKGAGCTDTDNNNNDFDVVTNPVPRNSATAANVCVADTTPPTVDSTVPATGATGVALDTAVSVTFSEAVQLTAGWAAMLCDASGSHTLTQSSGSGKGPYTLTVTGALTNNESCTVTVDQTKVKDLANNQMTADYPFTFQILPDTIKPTVVSTTPANNEENVALDSTITVNFSEPVEVDGTSFDIHCTVSGDHSVTLGGTPASPVLTSDSPFLNDDACTVTVVAANVIDLFDNPMAADYTFGFQTVPGTVSLSGVGSANPSSVAPGDTTALSVVVTPATNPDSTGLTVTCDLTPIGGDATQAFTDSGSNTFTYNATVGTTVTPGAKTLSCRVADAETRTSISTIDLTVLAPTDPAGTGTATLSSVVQGGSALLAVAVTPGSNPTSSGLGVTCDLSPIDGSATQAFLNDGSGNTFSYNATISQSTTPGDKTLNCTITDSQSRSGSATISLTVLLSIHNVQGAGHLSPFSGQRVTLYGIVTAVASSGSKGFWIEEPQNAWDSDDGTSEGIFVYTGSAPTVSAGQEVYVTGTVTEYRASSANATLTQLSSTPTYTVLSSGNPLPPAILIGSGTGGRVPPSTVIEPGSCDVETTCTYDPANHGIDFWESLEGMLVQFNNPVAVGPYGSFGIAMVADDATSTVRTPRGGIVMRPNDQNPERIILGGNVAALPTGVDVGDHLSGTVVGVVDYASGVYKMQATSSPTVISGGLQPVSATPQGANQVAVATFNVENLAPSSSDATFNTLAGEIINNLKAPDILAIEEIQDNSGATDNGTVAADVTWGKLIQFIYTASGNTVTYQYRQIDPVNNAEGGAPGANIRVGFLFRTDRGVSFVDRPGGTSTNGTTVVNDASGVHLTYSPGRVDPANPAWSTPEGTRRSLAGEFMFNGHHLFVIANHWKSKSDAALYAHVQPPTLTTQPQRISQAQSIHDFANSILTQDSNADVVVLGDLNDFQFSTPLATLTGTGNDKILNDLIETLPEDERYTYVYDGNSQTLDHILASNHLFNARPFVYLPVHVNAEFNPQASDHDPQVVTFTLNDPPTVDAGGPYMVNEGSTVIVSATGSDPEGGALTYAWDLDNDGRFDAMGQSISFSAAALDGPSTHSVTVQVTDTGGLTATSSATVTVNNVNPSISNVTNDGPINEGSSATITVTATDPAGANDPLQYEFDCDNNGTYEVGPQSGNSTSCAFVDNGSFTVNVRVTDGDGGSATDSTNVTVKNVAPTATFNAPTSATEGTAFNISLTSPNDPSSADTTAGLQYAFDCGSGYSAWSATTEASCTPGHVTSMTVKGKIKDKDAGETEYTATVTVTPTGLVVNTPTVSAEPSNEGTPVIVSATFTASPTITSFTCTVDYDDGSGAQASMVSNKTCTGLAHTYVDNGSYNVTVAVTDVDGTQSNTTTHVVNNVAPTATFKTPAIPVQQVAFNLSLTNPSDPSSADSAHGFDYAFDCGNGAGYNAFSATNTRTCTIATSGNVTVKGQIKDKDGGVTEYTSTIFVLPTVRTDLSIIKVVKPYPGQLNVLQYTLKVVNNGPRAAANTMVWDTLPLQVNFLSASVVSTTGGTCVYSTTFRRLNCALGSLPAKATAYVLVRVKWRGGTSATNCGYVKTSTFDTNTKNNGFCVKHDGKGTVLASSQTPAEIMSEAFDLPWSN